MTITEAKIIGSRQGVISVGLGLLIAQIIMTLILWSEEGLMTAFIWITRVDYKMHIFIGAVIMVFFGYFFGRLAGKLILINNRNFAIVGFFCGMAVLLSTAFFASLTGFFQEGLDNIGTNDNPFEDYIFKPLYWVTLFGIVPALIVGLWFGGQIKNKGKKFDMKHGTQQRIGKSGREVAH